MTHVIPILEVVLDPKMRGMCKLPYPNHPKGCPNFNHKAGCPPQCATFDSLYDLSQPVFAIVNEFDLGSHVARLKAKYPAWTDRQLECCLYWQPKARAELKAGICSFYLLHPGYEVDTCPEAGGVNVTETLARVGVTLEWPPKKIVRQVAFAARKRTHVDCPCWVTGTFNQVPCPFHDGKDKFPIGAYAESLRKGSHA